MDLLYLNRVAQHLVEDADALNEFQQLNTEQRTGIVQSLGMMTHQSHPTKTELSSAIESAGLKPTHTPCKMLLTGNIENQITRLWQLPNDELDKCFKLLMHLFRNADRRRKNACGDGCGHWWHQDLSDDSILQ